jgi:hypothetical protein
LSQIFLDVGVDPTSGSRGHRVSLVELCTCPEGYSGLSCDVSIVTKFMIKNYSFIYSGTSLGPWGLTNAVLNTEVKFN